MSINVPTYNSSNFSFGPGRLFLGAVGATPTVDVGAITEDGITLDLQNQKREITQGNPKIPIYSFSQAQGCMINLTGIEWNFTNLSYALGAGNTTTSASEDTFTYGGQPLVTSVALHVQHYMAQPGHTLDIRVWKAVSEGDVSIPIGQDEHTFPMSYKGMRVTTDWAGAALATSAELMSITRVK